MAQLTGLTFQGSETRSVSFGGRVASEMCETCGSAWATLQQESLIYLQGFDFFTACTGHEVIISAGPHPTLPVGNCIVQHANSRLNTITCARPVAQLTRLTFQGSETGSVSLGGRVASEVCETCGSAWATLQQESLVHLEDFYLFTACTGNEIIISSGPHPTLHVGNCIVQHAISRLNTITCERPVAL